MVFLAEHFPEQIDVKQNNKTVACFNSFIFRKTRLFVF